MTSCTEYEACADGHLVVAQVREREAEIDGVIGPIEDMYGLLARYEVRSKAWHWIGSRRHPTVHRV